MKIKIKKTVTATIDTSIERDRIKKAFTSKHDLKIAAKLYELMDMIEKQEWEKALKTVDGKWWRSYDTVAGCPRLEFIGMLFNNKSTMQDVFSHHASYLDLIYCFCARKSGFCARKS